MAGMCSIYAAISKDQRETQGPAILALVSIVWTRLASPQLNHKHNRGGSSPPPSVISMPLTQGLPYGPISSPNRPRPFPTR